MEFKVGDVVHFNSNFLFSSSSFNYAVITKVTRKSYYIKYLHLQEERRDRSFLRRYFTLITNSMSEESSGKFI